VASVGVATAICPSQGNRPMDEDNRLLWPSFFFKMKVEFLLPSDGGGRSRHALKPRCPEK
jgi:hypothetical protein